MIVIVGEIIEWIQAVGRPAPPKPPCNTRACASRHSGGCAPRTLWRPTFYSKRGITGSSPRPPLLPLGGGASTSLSQTFLFSQLILMSGSHWFSIVCLMNLSDLNPIKQPYTRSMNIYQFLWKNTNPTKYNTIKRGQQQSNKLAKRYYWSNSFDLFQLYVEAHFEILKIHRNMYIYMYIYIERHKKQWQCIAIHWACIQNNLNILIICKCLWRINEHV